MNTFLLNFDLTAVLNGSNPLILEILVGGSVVSQVVPVGGAESFNVFAEFSGSVPSSLSLRFASGTGDPGDSITFTNASINNTSLDVSMDFSMQVLSVGQSATVTATDESFGHTPPTIGPADILGTAGDDTNLKGGNAADTIDGLAGNDRILGRDNDDVINGDAGNDTIFGQLGDDSVLGGTGNDVIFGNEGDDILFGEGGFDSLLGGAGNDILNGGADADGLIGGIGNDRLFGEDGDDFLIGEDGDDLLFGDNGNDFLAGGAGNDALSGGDGNDQLVAGGGDDLLSGGAGNDEIIAGDGADIVSAGGGDDSVFGGDGNDELAGGNDGDYISGGAGNDILDGDAGGDVLVGGNGADTLNGGAGNDILHGNGLDATTISTILDANPNVTYSQDTNSFYQFVNNSISWTAAQTAANAALLSGVAGHLVNITSAAENELVYQLGLANGSNNSTGSGGNRIWLGATDNVVDQDWLWADGLEAGLQFSQASTATNNFYNNWGTGQPNNSGGAQTRATLWFNGGGDDDTWDDRNDTDTHDYVIEWDAGLFSDDNAVDTITGGAGDDTIYGYGGGDILSGGDNNDIIFGGGGADTINGDAGDDVLVGGVGADTQNGGDGNDNFVLLDGDFASGESLVGAANTDTITLSGGVTVDFTVGTISTVENLAGSGLADDVTYTIGQALDFAAIDLGAGTDNSRINVTGTVDVTALATPTINNAENGFLTGSAGDDALTITGAQLDDLIFGSGIIDFAGGTTDTINLTTTSADLNLLGATDGSILGLEVVDASLATGNVSINVSAQTEGFTIEGGSGADTLTGGSGADTIIGNGGDDIITGGSGADIIDGGNNNDTLILTNGSFASGESLTGGSGTDEIILGNATTIDFTTGTIAQVEGLTGSSGADDVTYTIQQALDFTTIDLGGGVDNSRINVTGSVDVTALATPTISNTENGFLTGSAGNDTLTITGMQLDDLIFGSGIIDFAGGTTDTINLTATSADLNLLGATDASVLGLEAVNASTAGASVTIDFSGQSEGFTLTGGGSGDTLIAGDGADTVNGGGGADVITGGLGADIISGGGGADTINLANGDFSAGETINGNGNNNDNITLTNATTVDFTTGTVTNVEILNGSTGNDTVTLSGTQFNGFNSVDLGGGATDTLNITATSTGLNGLNDASFVGVEIISAAGAAAGVTIDLSSQSENLTVTGGGNGDSTLITGTGDDTLNSGSVLNASIDSILTSNSEAIVGIDGSITHVYTVAGTNTYTLPGTVTEITVTAWGGGGGGGSGGNQFAGGTGGGAGFVQGTVTVTAGEDLFIAVGGGGGGGNLATGANPVGTGGGGGGYSGVFTDSASQANALFVAGGGGGGGGGDNFAAVNGGAGGASGGLNGSAGAGGGGTVGGGQGGTQIGGGATGTGNNASTVSGVNGSALAGGDGGDTTSAAATAGGASGINGGGEGGLASPTLGRAGGGGGGAGYFGGGGGTAGNAGGTSGAGGGGGSSFVDATATGTTNNGATGATPDQSDAIYIAGIGEGGTGGAIGTGGTDGGDGLVTLLYQFDVPEVTRLAGGTGNDDLFGADGVDIFEFSDVGATNQDTIFNFNFQTDKIDISDLLTSYDPLTEAITDFLQITDDGTDSEIRVDTAGTASFGAATVVATIDNTTGLTDEGFLEALNIIITA